MTMSWASRQVKKFPTLVIQLVSACVHHIAVHAAQITTANCSKVQVIVCRWQLALAECPSVAHALCLNATCWSMAWCNDYLTSLLCKRAQVISFVALKLQHVIVQGTFQFSGD